MRKPAPTICIYLHNCSTPVGLYSFSRIVNVYPHGKQLYQLEYSAYGQFLFAFSLTSSIHSQRCIGCHLLILPPSGMWFHRLVKQLDPANIIHSDKGFLNLLNELSVLHILVFTLCARALRILTTEECDVSTVSVSYRITSLSSNTCYSLSI